MRRLEVTATMVLSMLADRYGSSRDHDSSSVTFKVSTHQLYRRFHRG